MLFVHDLPLGRMWKDKALRSEAIFAALGYQDPSRVDLSKDHKRASKALGEQWPYFSGGRWIYRYPIDRG